MWLRLANMLRPLVVFVVLLLLLQCDLFAQTFRTYNSSRRSYPIVFVAAKRIQAGGSECRNYGLDVNVGMGMCSTGSLWLMLPSGTVRKIFPLPQHQAIVDAPIDEGMVLDPRASRDGNSLYFSYVHSVANPNPGILHEHSKGADIYKLNINEVVNNPSISTINVKRLTFQADVSQAEWNRNPNKFKKAINSNLASQTSTFGGIFNAGPIEVLTASGLKLVWTSNRDFRFNVAGFDDDTNIGIGLFSADINPDGSLSGDQGMGHFDTSSVLSPGLAREGFYVSYSANTEDSRKWDIVHIDSAGVKSPAAGYGTGITSFHFAEQCAVRPNDSTGTDDKLLVAAYYNRNNNGAGGIRTYPASNLGTNERTNYYFLPKPVGERLMTLDTYPDEDWPSKCCTAGVNVGQCSASDFAGKVTTPRCGTPGEFLFSYTKTFANHKQGIPAGQKNYHFKIAVRNNLDPFQLCGLNTSNIIIEDISDAYSLIYPTPILSFDQIYGDNTVAPKEPTASSSGEPFGVVMTGAIHDTDVQPTECFLNQPLDLGKDSQLVAGRRDQIYRAIEQLAYHRDPSTVRGVCDQPLLPENVFGLRVQVTEARTKESTGKERKYRLGDISVVGQTYEGHPDTSIKGKVPTDQALEFVLLDRATGMELASDRGWNEILPGQTDSRCMGCHNHQRPPVANATNNLAWEPETVPVDLVSKTPVLRYDPNCRPYMTVLQVASEELPFLAANPSNRLWKGFSDYCGACHTIGRNAPGPVQPIKFIDTSAIATRDSMVSQGLMLEQFGALNSPIWWAARGNPAYVNHLPNGRLNQGSRNWKYSAVHNNLLCDGSDVNKAEWVRLLGDWIDNHAPIEEEGPYSADGVVPSINAAINPEFPTFLNVGFWDQSGKIKKLTLSAVGRQDVRQNNANPSAGMNNGIELFDISFVQNSDDLIEIKAEDLSGNVRTYKRSLANLQYEAQIGVTFPEGANLSLNSSGEVNDCGEVTFRFSMDAPRANHPLAGKTFSVLLGENNSGTLEYTFRDGKKFKLPVRPNDPLLLASAKFGQGTLNNMGEGEVTFALPCTSKAQQVVVKGAVLDLARQRLEAVSNQFTFDLVLSSNPNGGGGENGGQCEYSQLNDKLKALKKKRKKLSRRIKKGKVKSLDKATRNVKKLTKKIKRLKKRIRKTPNEC